VLVTRDPESVLGPFAAPRFTAAVSGWLLLDGEMLVDALLSGLLPCATTRVLLMPDLLLAATPAQ
jgi:hypothetical protein